MAASEQIRQQSRDLKKELDREIDLKLRMKIKEHENERLKIRIGYKRSFPDWKLFRTDFMKINFFPTQNLGAI